MKIVTIVGARPQFIKAAAVSRAIADHNAATNDSQSTIHEIIVHTGQHFDSNMSDVFFDEMQIPKPDYFLDINSLSHGAMTGRMLEKIEEVLLKEKPDCVMVYGDTNSTIAGALAAKKLHIKVVHVEAGLRSFNMRMPEEINRILTDRISDILCCPTETAITNLRKEGFINIVLPTDHQTSTICHQPVVINIGDVMQDAALFYSRFSAEKSNIISTLGLVGKEFVLCTIHRAENTDDPQKLKNIFEVLQDISKEIAIVLPLHPRTRKILESRFDQSLLTNNQALLFIDPVGYFDMIELLKHAKIVMTDSGGLQKEAYFFKKPCITLRDETEWIELVSAGVNLLTGTSKKAITDGYRKLITSELVFPDEIYGVGKAAEALVASIVH